MKLLTTTMFLIAFFSLANTKALGHEIDLTINGDDYLVDILQSGSVGHRLDLLLENSNISEITVIQMGPGPWAIIIDGTAQNWSNPVEIGGICFAVTGCTLILE